ncbi:MAG: hypothetical protein ACJ76R_03525 [Solirubrobacteraceae bacterium]
MAISPLVDPIVMMPDRGGKATAELPLWRQRALHPAVAHLEGRGGRVSRHRGFSTRRLSDYTYDMQLEETRISVSLATVEFRHVGDNGTRLVFTEQGAFLDGYEFPARRAGGMGSLLDALEKEVQSEAPGA